ncbi:MAG: tetratricopeptide repeat protein, partial [Candidatus Firestonebacteria bacterium]
ERPGCRLLRRGGPDGEGDVAEVYGKNLLRTPEKNGILFVAGDNATFITSYLKRVELLRPDLTIYDESGNVFENIYGDDLKYLGFADYYKRVNETQWNILSTAAKPIYCVTGTNILNAANVNNKAYGLLFRLSAKPLAKALKFNLASYDTGSFENTAIRKDFLTRETLALFYFSLAECSFESGDNAAAERYYQKVETIGPDMDMIQNNISISYIKREMYDRAIPYAQKAISINPKFGDAYNNLGIIHYRKGNFNEAVKCYLKAISISGKDSYLYNLGAVYRQSNLSDEAIRVYEQALAVNPYASKLYYIIGNVYLDKKDFPRAIEIYNKGLSVEPNSFELLTNLGVAYAATGRSKEGVEAFKRSIAMSPNTPETHYGLGTVYYGLKDYQNAIPAFTEALRLNPSMVQGWVSLALSYNAAGDLARSAECYERIVKLRPENIEDWNNLGIAYGVKGDFEKSITAWQQALKLDPKYRNAALNIEKVKQMMKK